MPAHRKQLSFKDKDLWYLVGLIATDGNLSRDGGHIDITSKEYDYLEKLRLKLGLENKIGKKLNGKNQISYRIQFGNKKFYEFLFSIGLTPNKSLSLGELKIPDNGFADFVRGIVDGDGCIRNWIHPTNGNEQWSLRIYSASPKFIEWLQKKIEINFLAKGKIHNSREGLLVLKFGKLAAKRILKVCYYQDCFSLDRKARLAEICGSSVSGWNKSKTLLTAV